VVTTGFSRLSDGSAVSVSQPEAAGDAAAPAQPPAERRRQRRVREGASETPASGPPAPARP